MAKLGIPIRINKARLFLSYISAYNLGEKRHAQIIMKELSIKHGFVITESIPQSVGDGWEFFIEFDKTPKLPDYFNESLEEQGFK